MARALSIEPTGLKRKEGRIMCSIANYIGEPCSREEVEKHDGRLDEFLVNFFGLDWVTIRIGYDCGGECIEDLYVTIRDGELSPEDTQNVLDLLNSAGIEDSLPVFEETFCNVKLYLVGSSWEECDSPGDGDEEKTETVLWVTIISRGNT